MKSFEVIIDWELDELRMNKKLEEQIEIDLQKLEDVLLTIDYVRWIDC